jgi:fido (protein-threonine AMPylation protein)
LLRNAKERKELNKSIRKVNKDLVALGYEDKELSTRVMLNLDFARANMKANIYDQAVLEGVATSFPQTEDIIENGQVHGVSATDVQKILNLKHAWEFILDRDVIQSDSNYHMLCHIAKLVNEGFFYDGGRIRGIPVQIGGTSYVPPLPIESVVIERIDEIRNQDKEPIDIAIELCMYCMKTQVFKDGNKRASVIFANHFLIAQGNGFLVIPEQEVPEFKKLLVEYYEGAPLEVIGTFLRNKCWKNF